MEIIAEAKLKRVSLTNEHSIVTLKIGKPYPASDVDWACPVEAEGLFNRLPEIHGVDSFQALTLALRLLRSLLAGAIENGDNFYDPEGDSPIDLKSLFALGL